MKNPFRRALAAIAACALVAFQATVIASPPPTELDTSPPASIELFNTDTGQQAIVAATYDKIVDQIAGQAIPARHRELDTSQFANSHFTVANDIATTPAASQQGNYARIEELDTSPPLTATALVSDSFGAELTGLDTGQPAVGFSGYRTLVRSA